MPGESVYKNIDKLPEETDRDREGNTAHSSLNLCLQIPVYPLPEIELLLDPRLTPYFYCHPLLPPPSVKLPNVAYARYSKLYAILTARLPNH